LQTEQETSQSKTEFAQTVIHSIKYEVEKENPSNKEKGDRFVEWAITHLFDASSDEVRNQIIDGSRDLGIDAWIVPDTDTENKVIQLFQCKYNLSHKESEILQFQENIRNFLKKSINDIDRPDLKLLHKKIREEKLEPELYYITNKEVYFTKKTRKLKVYGIHQIIDRLWNDIHGIPSGATALINLEDKMIYNNTIIGVLSISNLKKFIFKTRDYIFESNIRKYLRLTKINKGLYETLKNRPADLFYFNNGITIVVKKYNIDGNAIELIEPQIVNGAQTSTTINEFLEYSDAVKGDVLVTIIEETNKTTRREITQYRNSQNAVKGKDLISLQSLHSGIRVQLRTLGYYYEQQAGAWNWLKKIKPNEFRLYVGHDVYNKYLPDDHDHHFQAKEAIQAMVAGIYQNPIKTYSSIASVLPNGTLYPKIFDEHLAENYRNFLYPYLIKRYGEKLGYGAKDSKPKQKEYARLYFVATYFKILFERILKTNTDEIRQNPDLMEKIFMNFDLNKKLLTLTDSATSYFLEYAGTWLEDHKEVSWHNFFANHAWKKDFQKSIDSHLNGRKEDVQAIRDELRNL